MAPLTGYLAAFLGLFSRTKAEKELSAELQYHLERKIEENIKSSLSPDEARRQALLTFGGIDQIKEACRDYHRGHWLEILTQDFRYSLRQLKKSPGFCLAVVLTLAIGIGTSLAVFSLFDSVVLRPLPITDPSNVFLLQDQRPSWVSLSFLYTDYLRFQVRNDAFVDMAAFGTSFVALNDGHETLLVEPLLVSANYFSLLGVKPQIGRYFLPAEGGQPGAAPVAVLGDRFWRKHFAADRNVIGKSIRLAGLSFVVVGVAPSSFRGLILSQCPELYVPLTMAEALKPGPNMFSNKVRDGYSPTAWLSLVVRLKDGMPRERAESIATAVVPPSLPDDIQQDTRRRIHLQPAATVAIPEENRPAATRFLLLLVAMVGFSLLVGCASLANLMMSRADQRRKEIAIRLSLGASRSRIVRQLMTEGFILSLLGGGLGVLLMISIIRWIQVFHLPGGIEIGTLSIGVTSSLIVLVLTLSILTTMLFSLGPAWRSSRLDLGTALKGTRGISRQDNSPARVTILVAELALCLPLLVSAGLFTKSLKHALSIDLGFDPSNLYEIPCSLGVQGYEKNRSDRFLQELLERVGRMPGVKSVSLTQTPGGGPSIYVNGIERRLPRDVWENLVDYRYFETMGLPLSRGRGLGIQDVRGGPKVAVINEVLAQLLWQGENPIGQRISCMPPQESEIADPVEVVGVVGNARRLGIQGGVHPQMYMPWVQQRAIDIRDATLVVRTRANSSGLIAAIGQEMRALDPKLPTPAITSLTEQTWELLAPQRLGLILLGWFGGFSLIVAVVGLFGLISYSVSHRTNEIGVRLALGAKPRAVLILFLRQGVLLTTVGIAIGLALALLSTRLLGGFLFEVGSLDPSTFVEASAVLGATTLISTFLSARGAMHVDVMTALRWE
jgi:predicted permease